MVPCWELDGLPNHKTQNVQTSLSIMTLETGQNLSGGPGLVEVTLGTPQSLGLTPLTTGQWLPGGKGKESSLTSRFLPLGLTTRPEFSVHIHGTELTLLSLPGLCV